MSKITAFNRATCHAFEVEVRAALETLAVKHGLAVRVGGGSFGTTDFRPKVEFAVLNEDGQAETSSAQAFKQLAHLYGVDAKHLHAVINVRGRKFELVGLNTRSTKFPFVAKDVLNGKQYKLSQASVEREVALLKSSNKSLVSASGPQITKGHPVKAKWEDGKFYPAVYGKPSEKGTGKHLVKFEDGSTFWSTHVKAI